MPAQFYKLPGLQLLLVICIAMLFFSCKTPQKNRGAEAELFSKIASLKAALDSNLAQYNNSLHTTLDTLKKIDSVYGAGLATTGAGVIVKQVHDTIRYNGQNQKKSNLNIDQLKDSLQNALGSIIANYRTHVAELTDSLRNITLQLNARAGVAAGDPGIYIIETATQEKQSKPTNAIPWLIALAGFIVAYFTFFRTARFKNYDFLSEIDKQLISNPALWMMYDKKVKLNGARVTGIGNAAAINLAGLQEISFDKSITVKGVADTLIKSSADFLIDEAAMREFKFVGESTVTITSPLTTPHKLLIDGDAEVSNCPKFYFKTPKDNELNDRLEAYCYYILNNFENVFINFGWIKLGDFFDAWERYLIEIMLTSEIFVVVVKKAIDRDYMSKKFTERLVTYKKIGEALKDSHTAYSNGKINKKEYNQRYKKQIKERFGKQKLYIRISIGVLLILAFFLVAFFFVW